ncbi:hypothetical protein NDU88_000875 [Pleurodeles waltl]|uniref:UPAR/Ly6 domain-containing protein n=1 Tax=Pleurodeles waltl TaxID=8319 RepID=A0AAV7Q218_PLEWA|nr:hypothetical protein NDU88_000875 [Pleurodeles waltl]
MNRFILASFLALCCLTAVRGLKCKGCDFKVWSICFSGSGDQDCTGTCSTTSTSIGSVSLFKKLECSTNCTAVVKGQDSVFKLNYDISCCNTELCNSASTNRLALTLAPAVALAWLMKAL